MKIITLSMILTLTTAQTTIAYTASEVFPGNADGMIMKGVHVRKGTIKASFDNAVRLNRLLNQKDSKEEIKNIIKDQLPLGRGLYALEVFEMQPLEGWLSDLKRPGKIMVAVLTLQVCPELMKPEISLKLKKLVKTSVPILKAEIHKVLDRKS